MPSTHSFHVVDYCIFGVTIAVSLGIGLYYALSGGKQRTTAEYFVGNRQMSILPVAISLMVSFESSIMMLGTPAEIYVYGLQWLVGNFGFFLANLMSIVIVVPLVHPLKITSAYEYLNLRFKNSNVRLLGTILGMMSYTAYMGIVLFGPAIALEGVTGLPQWVSIVSVATASVIYTSIGGLKAVIWTDVFQCAVMFAGFFAVLIKGTMEIGGIGKTWDIAYTKGRVNIFNFDPDPTLRHSFWSLFVGSVIRGFGLVFNQSSIQRISSTRTLLEARKVLLFVAPGFFLSLSLAGIEGVIAYAYYDTKGCDPLASKQITNPNQLIPYMVMDIFQNAPGMPGLFMASLFSASLSTLSSGLSSLSALFWADIIKPHTKPMSEFSATIISKISVVFFGGIAVLIAFLIAMVGGTLIQIAGSILSAFGGPLSGLFMFAAFCPWGNAAGAIGGTIISVIFTFTLALGQMLTMGAVKNQRLPSGPTDYCPVNGFMENSTMTSLNDTMMTTATYMTSSMMSSETTGVPEPEGFSRLFMLSYQWFGSVGILLVLICGTIISLCTGYKKPGEVERKYLIPFYDSLFPFLPECIRKPLRCGYEYPETEQEDQDEIVQVTTIGESDDPFHLEYVIKTPSDEETAVDGDVTKATITMVTEKTPNGTLPEKLTEKQPDGVKDTTGDAKSLPGTDTTDVTKSLHDVRPPFIPHVKDMELDIISTVTDGSDETYGRGFIVVDKEQRPYSIHMKAKSVEFLIRQQEEEAAVSVDEPLNDEVSDPGDNVTEVKNEDDVAKDDETDNGDEDGDENADNLEQIPEVSESCESERL